MSPGSSGGDRDRCAVPSPPAGLKVAMLGALRGSVIAGQVGTRIFNLYKPWPQATMNLMHHSGVFVPYVESVPRV